MPGTSELIDFRRAFVWLLCGMLLPSVALIAFGVVAVVNERVAVERRLETEYGVRLRTLDADVRARLQVAAGTAATEALARTRGPRAAPGGTRPRAAEREPASARPVAGRRAAAGVERGDGSAASEAAPAPRVEPLLLGIAPAQTQGADPVFADAVRRAQALAPGGHILAAGDAGGDRHLFALVRVPGPPETSVVAAQLDLVGLAAEIPRLAAARYPRESATFRLLPPSERGGATIAIHSQPGEGTRIEVRVPLHAPETGRITLKSTATSVGCG